MSKIQEHLREQVAALPHAPGIYQFIDRNDKIIYVGKAKNLRHRVLGYFRPGARHAPKVRSMVDTVWDFEFMTVRNEAESLLTEASLIKKYKPHFNILMRDDKRYLALRADLSLDFPMFTTCRIVREDGAMYFGPFPSAPVVRAAKDFVEKTKVDALAIAVGNAHGAYKLPPKLDFARIEKIRKTIDVPLVLHGGSGLTDNDFRKAIELGISKVNIFTDINIAAVKAEFRQFTSMDKGIIDLIPAAVEAIKQEVLKKLELFSSVGKAPAKYDVDKIVQAVMKELAAKQCI